MDKEGLVVERFEMQEVVLDGARIPYVDKGQGEPIVLLHGYPESHLAWRHLIEPLSAGHRVIAPDWIGWGEADNVVDLDYTFTGEVERLARFLDLLALGPCNLFAHDYGGLIGLGLVVRQPERVLRFAILNSRAHRTFPFLYRAGTAVSSTLARTPVLWHLIRWMPLRWMHERGLRLYLADEHRDDEVTDHYLRWLDTDQGRRWYARFFQHYQVREVRELSEGLDDIAVPTAVIWGDSDGWCPARVAEDLAERIPGAELTLLEGAGHFVMEERPDEVLAALTRLLQVTP